jgi:TolA-binding protein
LTRWLAGGVVPWSFLVCASAGCAWDDWHLFGKDPTPPAGSQDNWVMRGGNLEPDAPKPPDLLNGHELFRRGDFAGAEKLFHKVADNTKNVPSIAEEARFWEAESLRCQSKFPKAVDVYHKQLLDFPSGAFREQAMKRMFDIANYWLDDTRQHIREESDGKHWVVWPEAFVHWEKAKPIFDEEGRAMEALEQVEITDMTNPLAAEALFLTGTVKFYHRNYREADEAFSQLVQFHPRSKYASKAAELAIVAKHMSTGGSDYDGRKTDEARRMVYLVQTTYSDLAADKNFIARQLAGIDKQQAEKDLKMAEFYRRTGHPCPAYFYYDIVRLRYPESPFAKKAAERMAEIEAAMRKKGKPVPPTASGGQAELAPMPKPLAPGQSQTLPEIAPSPRPVGQ